SGRTGLHRGRPRAAAARAAGAPAGGGVKRAPLILLALALAVVALAASAAARRRAADYWVCVTNEQSGDLTVIDGMTRTALFTIPLGKRPRGIHASPDGRTLYVALTGSVATGPPGTPQPEIPPPPDRAADGIGVVDLAQRRVL